MQELPAGIVPNGCDLETIDFGFLQRPSSGAAALRVDRPGTRYRATVSFHPLTITVARGLIAVLQRAKREGLRIFLPLLGASQGSPGAPVVDGAGQAGTSLALRGLTANYAARAGFWLTIVAATGERYLHQVVEPASADAGGDIAIEIEPPLRAPFADGDTVLLARPTIEGWLTEDLAWSLSVEKLVTIGGGLVLEEAA